MPTTGNVTVVRARERRPDLFDAQRLRQLARNGEARERLRAQRASEREAQRSAALARRSRGQERRTLLAESAGDAEQARQQARMQYDALRSDPAYGIWRAWAGRMDRGTLYDAKAWRTSGRLVPVGEHMKYQGGGRREVIDWTDALDREAQGIGMDARDLPAHFERLRRQDLHARELAREAERKRDEHRELRAILSEAA